ncbi:MAG TPA: aminoglycoside phosphotransferase family protein [Gaiellaceae bacterium]|nr:aminoglycoside phosphotransferase family protein [Gaiellaceae bacterium]
MPWEHYAAVPGDDGGSLLVVGERLPCVLSDDHVPLPRELDALAPLVGRPRFLRLGAHVDLGDRCLRLVELDASAGDEQLAVADADPEALAPPELVPALTRWLDEQRGAPVPPARPAWSRPGWHAHAEAWAGQPLRQERVWPLSAVLAGEGVYLKAVFGGFRHEPAVTQALAREHPGSVPEVLRIEEHEGLLLTAALHGKPGWECDSAAAAFETLERIQHAWRGRLDELAALGAPDRTLPVLERAVEGLVADAAPELADAVPELERACRELASRGEPPTICHGDFHPGNVVVDDGGGAVIFDWSDTCIAYASFDRHLFLFDRDDPGGDDPLAALGACLHQGVSYRDIVARFAPDDRWWFADEPRRWLDRAVALL